MNSLHFLSALLVEFLFYDGHGLVVLRVHLSLNMGPWDCL